MDFLDLSDKMIYWCYTRLKSCSCLRKVRHGVLEIPDFVELFMRLL